jgi:Flp pilus assembly protein TadG
MRRLRDLISDERGVSAAEFAMIVPLFLALTIGLLNFCFLIFWNQNLHFAVEDAVRCQAVGTCASGAAAVARANADFNFPSLAPSFSTPSIVTCGYQMTGTATYNLNWVLSSSTVTLSATSCFPKQN